MVDIVVSGGGLDSTALFMILQDKVPNLFVAHVEYGQVSNQQECDAIISTLRSAGYTQDRIISVENTDIQKSSPNSLLLGTGTDPIVRGRNLQIVTSCAAQAISEFGIDDQITLYLGLLDEPGQFPDATKDFVDSLRKLMYASWGETSDGTRPLIDIAVPLINTPKLEAMVQAYKSFSKTFGGALAYNTLWNDSFTCWTPTSEGKECGECKHCTKKKTLLDQFNKLMPTL